MNEIDEDLLAAWKTGRAHEKIAFRLYRGFIRGNEPGTQMPAPRSTAKSLGLPYNAVCNANKLLAKHGMIIRKNRVWVIA